MKRTVMIVDDSQIIRNRLERHLQNMGAEVVGTAKNGKEALALYEKHQPQMVTMDLTMPHMDGLACIKALCNLSSEVRILVISALSDKSTGIKAIKLGARGFLYKPFTDAELLDALHEMFND